MKRCPECLFIYPETDTSCDFDHTPLVTVDDAELESATSPATPAKKKRAPAKKKRARKKATAVAAVVGLMLGVTGFLVYYSLTHRRQETVEIPTVASASASPVATPPHVQTVSTPPLAIASPTPGPVRVPSSSQTATSHTRTTAAPVSTSGPGIGKKPSGRPVIVLTTGERIEADEVWRTRDGIWYRRGGIVTLLKNNRVKAIVNH